MKKSICLAAAAVSSIALAGEPTTGNVYLPTDKTPWVAEAGAPVELAALWGDRAKGEAGTLLRTPPHFQSGGHSHTADYRAIVVQGVWQHWIPSTGEGVGLNLEAGAYWTQVHTQLHEDACVSDEPCIILLLNKEPYVTEYPTNGAQ